MRFRISLAVAAVTLAAGSPAFADLLITVDKTAQTLTVSREGQVLHTWPVSTGRTGRFTPAGSFRAFRMEKDHYSQEFDDAPMPNSIFFTQRGHAIHGSFDVKKLGRPASGGCVRLAPQNAEVLFNLVKTEGVLKTKVEVAGDERVAIARANASGNADTAAQARANPQYREPRAPQDTYARGNDPQFGNMPRNEAYQQPRYDERYGYGRQPYYGSYYGQQPYYGQQQYYPPQGYYQQRRYGTGWD